MFRPIKNFITFIQKNASGTSLFGGSTSETEVTQASKKATAAAAPEAVAEESEREFVAEENFERDFVKVAETAKMNINNFNCSNARSTADSATLQSFDENDIETQIKSSIMLRKPINSNSIGKTMNGTTSAVLKKSIKNHDHNQNHAINNELEDFQRDPLQNVVEDFCSVGSEGLGEETEEFITEGEDETVFLDLPQELKAFPNSEIIVLNEPDLNSSLNSDGISEDPLAIDEIIEHDAIIEVSNPLDCNADASGDILWINIDDMKCEETTSTQNDPCEISPSMSPQKSSTVSSTDQVDSTPQDKSSSQETTEELRSEGSDSGLGSETSALQTTITSPTNTNSCTLRPTVAETIEEVMKPTTVVETITSQIETVKSTVDSIITSPTSSKKPLRSNLKRRLEAEDDSLDAATVDSVSAVSSVQKKPKRSINFDSVQVYYFPRQQGFGCVPSAGGCTLGMGAKHVSVKKLSLAEHAAELRRAHRQQLQEVNPRGSSSDESEESEEDYLSEGSGSDLDAESSGFLQPVSPKQRRALLKAAGVRKIDASEKAECRDIRNSREVCGCSCRDFCDPETCACSQAGIKCQVDRAMFPCGCSRDACGNTVGRVEFNPSRVRTHFIHTIMRLEMESRHQQKTPSSSLGYSSSNSTSSSTALNQMTSNFYSMQPQSNYSSGYASPAYPGDPTQNFYQQQTQQYQVDSCLETSLFSGAATATPSYGELMPSYGNDNITTVTPSYNAPLNYPSLQNAIPSPVTSYSAYTHSSSNYLQNNTNSVSTFSSCAVPSAPPFGTATTTVASSLYLTNCAALETTTAASTTIRASSTALDDSSFISLNSPVSSSSRLSQINDLLQHNRNTTAALVAVTHTANTSNVLCSQNTSTALSNDNSMNASINTPPIDYAHKNCLAFEEIPSPLNPTPIVGVVEPTANKSTNIAFNGSVPTKPLQNEPPPAALPGDTVITPVEQPTVEVTN